MSFQQRSQVQFPSFTGINVNMMPILAGQAMSVPTSLHGYLPMMDACGFEGGSTVYLTITETDVEQWASQRRDGIHTEGYAGETSFGGFGGQGGLCIASTDGRTRVWDCIDWGGDKHGGLAKKPSVHGEVTRKNTLYWLTDRTPHEALPAMVTGPRQFFRLVSDNVDEWCAEHSTANPLGVPPNGKISSRNKFA